MMVSRGVGDGPLGGTADTAVQGETVCERGGSGCHGRAISIDSLAVMIRCARHRSRLRTRIARVVLTKGENLMGHRSKPYK